MREIEFRNWLIENGTQKKVAGDTVSRLRKVEKEFDQCDIDEQYHIDRCEFLMNAFKNSGKNEYMSKYPDANFPIGKYYICTYRYALKKYVAFCEVTSAN